MASLFRSRRYRTRLIAGVLIVSLPVTALIVAGLTQKASQELTDSTKQFLQARADHIADNIELEITRRRQDVSYVAARVLRLPPPEQSELMSELMRQRGGYDAIQFVDLNGKVVTANTAAAAFAPPVSSEWFRVAVTGSDTVSPVYMDTAANTIRWVFASTVSGPNGLPVGVILADVQVTAVAAQLAQADFARTAQITLVDPGRRLILRESNRLNKRVLATDADALAEGALANELNSRGAELSLRSNGVLRFTSSEGADVYGGYAPVRSMGWGLIVTENVSEALSAVRAQRNLGLLLAAGGALLLVLFAFLFSRREVRFVRSLVSESKAAGEEVTANAAEMSSAAEELASTTMEQTGTVTETSATMEELARSSTAIAATVAQVAQQAGDTRDSLEQAARDIEASSERTLSLSERVGQITGILDLINDLADQTNILAVNAAIEAARAGEAGVGFAVVADEVRRLAERSKTSAAEIGAIIESTQEETAATVTAMETGARRMAHGLRLLEQVAEGAAEVSLNTQQQGVATGQVVEAMEQLTESSRQVSATAQQIAAAAGTLAALASQLEAAAASASSRL